MKWFFCWCQETEFRTDHGWPDLIRAAVESARQNTNLEPHFIYDGEPSELTNELQQIGVTVHFHRLSFADAIEAHSSDPGYRAVARGAFLRFDIPLFTDDLFVLYTDADVIFRPAFSMRGYCPDFLAAAPQFNHGAMRDLNSGVMILNVLAWRDRRSELLGFTRRNLNVGFDQEILREFVGTDYLLLPDRFNWKPYWGIDPDAAIVHWHGPKPETVALWLADRSHKTHAGWLPLLEGCPIGYAFYMQEQQKLLRAWEERMSNSSLDDAGRMMREQKLFPPITMDSFDWTHFEHPLIIPRTY